MSPGRDRWTVVSKDPPAVLFKGQVWLVCPVGGFDCARLPMTQFDAQMTADVMAVHVAVSHSRWS